MVWVGLGLAPCRFQPKPCTDLHVGHGFIRAAKEREENPASAAAQTLTCRPHLHLSETLLASKLYCHGVEYENQIPALFIRHCHHSCGEPGLREKARRRQDVERHSNQVQSGFRSFYEATFRAG